MNRLRWFIRKADPFTWAVLAARVLLGAMALAAVVCMYVFAPLGVSAIITGTVLVIGLIFIASEPL